MRIAVAPADSFGCGYYRMALPGKALAKRGHDVVFVERLNDPRLPSVQVLVLQRQYQANVLAFAKAMQDRGCKLVFEFDDNHHTIPSSNPNVKHFSAHKPYSKAMDQAISEADLVTVSTLDLRDEYLKLRPTADPMLFVCPNGLDDAHVERWAPKAIDGLPKREGEIRIGWAGTTTHRGDFGAIAPALAKVMHRHPEVRLVFLGDNLKSLLPGDLWARCTFVGTSWTDAKIPAWSDRDDLATIGYYRKILEADFDLAIAPIESTTFNRCKSALKLMEYGMLGAPAVASNFGPYRRYAREAPEPVCLLADDRRGWEAALERLVASSELRAELASANLAYVRSRHVMSVTVDAWAQAYDALEQRMSVAA